MLETICRYYPTLGEGAIAAISRIYPALEDHSFIGMGHGEIVAYPDQMAAEIVKFIKKV